MKRLREETRDNLPERLALVFECRKKDFISKHSLAFICACRQSSISPALSILRNEGYTVLMRWNRLLKCWNYNIRKPKK